MHKKPDKQPAAQAHNAFYAVANLVHNAGQTMKNAGQKILLPGMDRQTPAGDRYSVSTDVYSDNLADSKRAVDTSMRLEDLDASRNNKTTQNQNNVNKREAGAGLLRMGILRTEKRVREDATEERRNRLEIAVAVRPRFPSDKVCI